MYNHFVGRLVEKQPTQVVIEAGGVGYRLDIPVSTYERLPDGGSPTPARLLAYLHVREDQLRLFGFATEAERRLFEHLLDVKGVGPTIALHILSATSVAEIVRAIRDGDSRFLDKIKGIGKKTAERIVLELKEKADQHEPPRAARAGEPGVPAGAPGSTQAGEDAVRALVSLGYTPGVARKAVGAALEALGTKATAQDVPVEKLVKDALRHTT